MKNKLLLFLTLFIHTILYSQSINRGELAITIFEELYGVGADPLDYPASKYPSVFLDLQEGSPLTDAKPFAIILSYLEFGDGVAVVDRNNIMFGSGYSVSKIEFIRNILEAWKIPPSNVATLPYADFYKSDFHPDFGYIRKAYELGLLSNTTNIFPYNDVSYSYVNSFINKLKAIQAAPGISQLNDKNNYFIPNNYQIDNLSLVRGIEQAVFSHYAKNSFVIPDRKLNLNFSQYYSTQIVELPQSYFPIKPLGRGWTHTYNSYIIREDNVIGTDDLYYIVWANGSIHVFNQDEDEYITKGVYDEFDEDSSTTIYITKKNQIRYKYRKLDKDRKIYYLIEIRDPNGNEINIDYENAEEDDTKRIETVESPSGKKLKFKYQNNTDLIERVEDPIGRKIYFEYSGVSSSWAYQYPVLTAFDDAKGNTTTYSYGVNNNFDAHLLKRIRLPEGNIIKAKYDDNNNGKLESYIVNENDEITIKSEFNFDSDTPLHSEVRIPMPKGGKQKYEYDYNNNGVLTKYRNDVDEIKINYPTSSSSNVPLLPTSMNINGLDIDYDYDNDGNLEEMDIENGGSVKKYKFDNDNNLTKYTDPEGNITKFSYDSNENLIQIEDALGNTINYTYDNYGQLLSVTNQEGIDIHYSYKNDGAVATITAPEGISSSFDYDGINRLLSKKANGLTTKYTYDKNDNLTSFKNSGGFTTSYDYDKNDNTVSIINTKGVATVFKYNDKDQLILETFGNLEKKYRYNDDGSIDRFTKPSNTKINYDYDNDGRLKKAGTITDIDYNKRNLIENITNNVGRMGFRYDNLNRLERVITVDGYKIEYDYEKTGLIDEITYPTINNLKYEVRYSYDKKNRIWQVILDNGTSHNGTVIAEYKYYKDDRIRQIDYANNTRTYYSYDGAGRLNYIEHKNKINSNSFYVNNLTLDNRGNIIKSNELLPSISITSSGYLPAGSGVDKSYLYNKNNHAIKINGITHQVNNDGNTSAIGGDIKLEYDIHDRLIQYEKDDKITTFRYNAYGQRVAKIVDGITKKYIRDVRTDNVLVALDKNNNPIYYYIYSSSGKLIARINILGQLQYYHSDVRGSTIAITDDNADILHKYRYDDFGKVTLSYEPDNDYNPYRYVGTYGVETDDNDLYYMRARYYKPSVGRFLTEDTVWSTNLYPYADNNPISRVDPGGKQSTSSLSSIYDSPKKDPTVDTFFFGLTGTVIPLIGFNNSGNIEPFTGFNFGMHSNFIMNDSSLHGIPTLTYGENKGFDFGLAVELGFCRDWVDSDFSETDLDSNKTNGFALGFGGVGYSYQYTPTQDGRNIHCHAILIGPDFGFSFNTNRTRRLLDD